MTITISPSKARELSLSSGDVVAVIGRRRRATLANVSVSKKAKTKSTCIISKNLSKNLRLRDTDKLKIEALGEKEQGSVDEEVNNARSGDLLLANAESKPEVAASVTLSPLSDSLERLQKIELNGDEMSDEAIMERFIAPYLNLDEDDGSIMLKKGHIISVTDENGVTLDFIVDDLDVEGIEEEEEADEDGK